MIVSTELVAVAPVAPEADAAAARPAGYPVPGMRAMLVSANRRVAPGISEWKVRRMRAALTVQVPPVGEGTAVKRDVVRGVGTSTTTLYTGSRPVFVTVTMVRIFDRGDDEADRACSPATAMFPVPMVTWPYPQNAKGPPGRAFLPTGVTGLEPAASGLTVLRSNQLSYTPGLLPASDGR